jgi:hypothetical protein
MMTKTNPFLTCPIFLLRDEIFANEIMGLNNYSRKPVVFEILGIRNFEIEQAA